MKFWMFVVGVVILFVSLPYIRCFFKRLNCSIKIKNVCNENNERHATDTSLHSPAAGIFYAGGRGIFVRTDSCGALLYRSGTAQQHRLQFVERPRRFHVVRYMVRTLPFRRS